MIRLFIAFPLQRGVEEKLGEIIAVLRDKGGRVKWVAPQNIHLTARFLGDTEEPLVERLTALIDDTAAGYDAVGSLIDRLGAFPNLVRPRVIWAGLRDNTDILATTEYDGRFTCAVALDNIHGVQFHPEKSHRWGNQLLENFARL